MSQPNICTRCNAVMPSHRVCNLCEECYAEEWRNDHDDGDDEDNEYVCGECDGDGLSFDGLSDCEHCDGTGKI
jgi:RecJ-like exonuclease